MMNRLYSIGACLQLQVDVRIGDFVAWCAVSYDQKGGIVVGRIQEVVTIASARREGDTGVLLDRLASRIGDEDEFTLDDVNEFILLRVGVPGRRLATWFDTYEVDAVVFEPTVIAETPAPSFALAITEWRRIRRPEDGSALQPRRLCRRPQGRCHRPPARDYISTSHVERSNLSMRMHMRRCTRLSNAHSKKFENHCYMVSLYTVWYNFVRINKAVKMAPAMAAGVSKTLWTMDNIVGLIDAAAPQPSKRGRYKKCEIAAP